MIHTLASWQQIHFQKWLSNMSFASWNSNKLVRCSRRKQWIQSASSKLAYHLHDHCPQIIVMDGRNGFGMWAGSSSVNVLSSYGKKIQSALGNEVITIRIAGVGSTISKFAYESWDRQRWGKTLVDVLLKAVQGVMTSYLLPRQCQHVQVPQSSGALEWKSDNKTHPLLHTPARYQFLAYICKTMALVP